MFSKTKEKTTSASNDDKTPVAPLPSEPADATAEAAPSPAIPEAEPPPAEPPKPSAEAAELAVLKDRYARLMADFDNFRKRQIREREDWIKRANEALLGDLLPVVDHLELALTKNSSPDDPFAAGVKMVYDQFSALLARYDMTPIDAKGQPFDPNIHEALSQMSSATVPAHVVLDQFRRGWRLAGKLLRPAQVIVSSGSPEPEAADSEASGVSD